MPPAAATTRYYFDVSLALRYAYIRDATMPRHYMLIFLMPSRDVDAAADFSLYAIQPLIFTLRFLSLPITPAVAFHRHVVFAYVCLLIFRRLSI